MIVSSQIHISKVNEAIYLLNFIQHSILNIKM